MDLGLQVRSQLRMLTLMMRSVIVALLALLSTTVGNLLWMHEHKGVRKAATRKALTRRHAQAVRVPMREAAAPGPPTRLSDLNFWPRDLGYELRHRSHGCHKVRCRTQQDSLGAHLA